MRVLHAAVALAVLAGVTVGPLSAQSLGDLAAQEKQKRQGKPAPKVITEQELAKAGKRGTVSFAGETPAEGTEAAPVEASAEGSTEGGATEGAVAAGEPGAAPAKKEKSEEEIRAERRTEWQKAYDLAKKRSGCTS
jgi:hypothetical protein